MVLFDSCSQDMDQFPGSDIFMCEYVYDESFKVRSPASGVGAGTAGPSGWRGRGRLTELTLLPSNEETRGPLIGSLLAPLQRFLRRTYKAPAAAAAGPSALRAGGGVMEEEDDDWVASSDDDASDDEVKDR